MGTEAIWVPLVLAAAGATAQTVNNRNIAKERERIANQGIAAQASKQREAEARINEELGAQARSSPEAEQRESLNEFTSALASAKSKSSGETSVPMGSDRYQTDETASKAAIQNYGEQQADIQSRIMAPLRQRENEDISRRRTGGDVAGIARNADAEAFLNQLLQGSVTGNTGLELGGAIATGAAQATAGSMGGVPSSAQTHAMLAPSRNSLGTMFKGARKLPISGFTG